MNRADYWNETYVTYWKEKVKAANTLDIVDITAGDSKTSGDTAAYQLFDRISYIHGNRILDFGCGYGRFYDFFQDKGQDYYGIDISQAMIDEFSSRYPEVQKSLSVAEGEHLPFSDEYFDVIVCYGVFDACYQEQALGEMLRVCTVGGNVIISGKNIRYFLDDEGALIAERNARRKGHPNYFTDVHNMQDQLRSRGVDIVHESYYLRRSDIETGTCVASMPQKFYAWEMILKKTQQYEGSFSKFSDLYSNSWSESGWED